MTFSGALKFTYASLTLTFNNKNTWLKNLFEELKLGNLETVKAALVDVSIKGKVDANGSFSVNGSVDVGKITVNGSSFSVAASSNNLINYDAPSGTLYTNGNIRILKTFYLSTFSVFSFHKVNPKIKIPPSICQIVIGSLKTKKEIATATNGSK